MVLVPVGESAVSISINGTERVNDLIKDDTTYDLSESFNTTVSVNGSQKGSYTQSSNSNYDISVQSQTSANWTRFGGQWYAEDDTNTPTDYYSNVVSVPMSTYVYGWAQNMEGYYDYSEVSLQYSTDGGSSWTTWLSPPSNPPKFEPHETRQGTRYFSSGTQFRMYMSDGDRYEGKGYVDYAPNGTWTDKSGRRHLKTNTNVNGVNKS